ncbi:type II CAAX endopeptidase family protein [Thermoflexus sp.]|uniref:type II CAAX endopeptidase family protein n=1 Tax=Thermoflexus sp. TaxID=1969742 RepID=UPI0025E896FD|nr:type II CAAX endopeptidase family protein [Thermoflexus sp.]MDW8181698.1 type II CAAX endopeptidase family protein [Anaerolineae bacterium]MCS6964555.1 CPBP family intramembrane metalloprotease [Thermoflexus sp.]MCS7352236.1 CPBP family intramembrane metalloprotease [Thermoflexus sp.]MCX7690450.1 CPBP family intramembrane metalloprotease [Thermoflexus sp.]MDW8186098.1 type II CAAX endopeptidase family protein [Anaerolineae bacterium]
MKETPNPDFAGIHEEVRAAPAGLMAALRKEWPGLGLWIAAVLGFGSLAFRQEEPGVALSVLTLFAVLMGGYLGSAGLPVDSVRRWMGADIRRIYGIPFALWFGGGLLRIIRGASFDFGALLLGLAILLIPTMMVVHNRARWKAIDVLMVAGSLAFLLIPGPSPSDPVGWAFRIGAGLWPIPFLLGWPRETRSRSHLLFFGAVLFLWYAVEFQRFPENPLIAGGPSYDHLAVIVLFLWLLILAGRFPDLGFTFRWTWRDVGAVGLNLAGFAAFALPFGLLTDFIAPAASPPGLPEALIRLLAIYLFIGLPEEILFRGTLHVHFQRVLGWPPLRTLILSSLLFGLAHLNNPPKVGLYVILATVAGFFYGRTYLQTGKVTAAAMVHAVVDWVWSVLFR